MLNHRRFIGSNGGLDLKTYTTALDLHSNCTIFLLHGTPTMETKGQVRKLSEIVIRFSIENNLPSFASGSRRSAYNDRGNGKTNPDPKLI